jgi:hypothetical protein
MCFFLTPDKAKTGQCLNTFSTIILKRILFSTHFLHLYLFKYKDDLITPYCKHFDYVYRTSKG